VRLTRIGHALLAVALFGATRAPEVRVVVIVNSANSTSTLRREQVSKIYLRQVSTWDNGAEILPVDQTERSLARIAFSRSMQGQTVRALKTYWQQRIFSGDESPPPERVTDSDVLTYVRSNSGAIGYVTEGTDLGQGVKAVVITELAHDATSVNAHG
jgi:ABC-type phosphate transport system substrate-binding protein